MKELSGTARNYYYTVDDDGDLKLQIELVVIVSEPQWRIGANGMIRERVSETLRISTNQKGIKLLLKDLMEADNNLEKLEQLVNPLKKEADLTHQK